MINIYIFGLNGMLGHQIANRLTKNNQFNFSLVVPERGKIYDRKGRVLAANRDAFSLYIKSSQNLNLETYYKLTSEYENLIS